VATAALLAEEVIEEVGHARWVFVVPEMLQSHFLHQREQFGIVAGAAWPTALELMCAAAGDSRRPGINGRRTAEATCIAPRSTQSERQLGAVISRPT